VLKTKKQEKLRFVKKEKNKVLVLLDVHAILHRAYHALPDFATRGGEPTGGLYGLVALLFKLVGELSPDYIIACYDLPKPTFRDNVYADYKAGRPKTDDALVLQIKRSSDVFEALNIPAYSHEGFEADDIIGTIAEEVKGGDIDVIIASGDMDTLQLVDGERVRVYTLRKGLQDTILYDENKVRERFGFGPLLLPDYKGLRGDPSDNIPGVPGIGEKTATDLIVRFGNLENIYKKLDEAKGNEGLPSVALAREGKGVKPRIVELLREHKDDADFSKMLGTVRRDAPCGWKLPKQTWRKSVDVSKFENLCKELEFKTLAARARAVLCDADTETREISNVSEEEVIDVDMESEEWKRAAIALFLLDSEKTRAVPEDVFERTKKGELKVALSVLENEITKEGLDFVYRNIELPIVSLIKEATERGVRLDSRHLTNLSSQYHNKQKEIEGDIFKHAGHEFNINSPKQLGTVLFDELGLAVKGLKKTEGGARSTRESELVKMKDAHPIIQEIMDFRELGKLLSTYVDVLPRLADERGRVHTTLNQTGAATGRMSSDSPNLQNIPHHGSYGDEVRNAFISTPKEDEMGDGVGYVLASFDYSQIEMRLLATLSGDEHLMSVFREDKDPHSAVASRVFGVALADVTPEMRRKAKVINFGIMYGMGIQALKANLGTDMAEAKRFHVAYFEAYPTIAEYFEGVVRDAKRNGYTETLFGRRRYLPDLKSHVPYIRASAERMAMNAPIQGTATGDIIKLAITKARDALLGKKLLRGTHLLLQVHDELLYEIRDDRHTESKIQIIKEAMERAVDAKLLNGVPLRVNVATGKKWGTLETRN